MLWHLHWCYRKLRKTKPCNIYHLILKASFFCSKKLPYINGQLPKVKVEVSSSNNLNLCQDAVLCQVFLKMALPYPSVDGS